MCLLLFSPNILRITRNWMVYLYATTASMCMYYIYLLLLILCWAKTNTKCCLFVIHVLYRSAPHLCVYAMMNFNLILWTQPINNIFFSTRESWVARCLVAHLLPTMFTFAHSLTEYVLLLLFFFMCENVAKAVKCTMHKTYTYKNPVNRCSVNSKTRREIERERGKKPLLPQSTVQITYAFM